MKVSLKKYTFILLATCLLGVNFFSFDLGFIQLSIYRILILITPFFFFNVFKSLVISINYGKSKGYIYFLLFWIFYSFVSVVWVQDYGAWAKALSFLLTGSIISLFIFAFIKTKHDLFKALKTIEVFSIAYVILALYEIYTGHYLFVVEKNLEYFTEWSLALSALGFREPVTVFGNPNDFALFLFFSFIVSLSLIHMRKGFLPNLYSGLILVLVVFIILTTQSRSVFIGLCLFAITYGIYWFLKLSLLRRIRFFVITLSLLIVVSFSFHGWADTFSDLTTINLVNPDVGSSESVRINLIKNGFYSLYSTFGMGVGLGNIEYYMNNHALYDVGDVRNIHNWWMEILVSSGILVFMIYITVYIKNMFLLINIARSKAVSEIRYLALPFLSFFPAFIAAAIGSSSLMGSEWIWPLMALVMNASSILEKESGINTLRNRVNE